MDENSSPATNDAPVVDTYGFDTPDALETELSQDAESAYVDKVLGLTPKEAKDDKGTEKPDDKPAPVDEPEKPITPPTTPNTPPTPVEKPAEVKPAEAPTLDVSDLWVDVQDREGKTVRITLEDGIPDDFTFKNDKALYDVMDAMREMKDLKAGRESEIADWQKEQDAKAAAAKVSEETVNGWNQEIDDLFETGILEKPKAPPANGQSYTPEEIAADPALQIMNGVFDFMRDENVKRDAAGKPAIKSYGLALSLYQNQAKIQADAEAKAQKEIEDKAEAEVIKKRGAVVGGTSTPTADSKGFAYKRGSAKNIWQVDTSDI